MNFLGEIAAVPWAQLHHAYGPATDVPDQLRALMTPSAASEDFVDQARQSGRTVFEHATWTLWGNVFHQGTVWQVTPVTVPFLVEILRNGPDDPAQHEFLISYLHSLAVGYPGYDFADIPSPDDEFASVDGLSDHGEEPDFDSPDIDERFLIWRRDSYEAVEKSIEFILPFAESEHDAVAEAALAFFTSFPRRTDLTLPWLKSLAMLDNRRGALATLSMSALEDPETPRFAEKHVASNDLLTSIIGACAMALYQKADVSPDIVASLARPLGSLGETNLAHVANVNQLIVRCFEAIGPEHFECAVDQLCTQLVNAKGANSVFLSESLLGFAFPYGIPDKASELSTTQRKAVETIRDHGAFRIAGSVFGNFIGLLARWGLPQSAEEIDTWLRGGHRVGAWERVKTLLKKSER